jgi:hypothetical protein
MSRAEAGTLRPRRRARSPSGGRAACFSRASAQRPAHRARVAGGGRARRRGRCRGLAFGRAGRFGGGGASGGAALACAAELAAADQIPGCAAKTDGLISGGLSVDAARSKKPSSKPRASSHPREPISLPKREKTPQRNARADRHRTRHGIRASAECWNDDDDVVQRKEAGLVQNEHVNGRLLSLRPAGLTRCGLEPPRRARSSLDSSKFNAFLVPGSGFRELIWPAGSEIE